jgi:tRNA-dihydrouridine synthase
VTAARGAIGNPWLFAECRALAAGTPWSPPTLAEQRAVIEEHYRLADETYGPRRAGPIMRKFGIKYARLHPKARQVRDAFVAVRQPEDWRAVLDRWYPA